MAKDFTGNFRWKSDLSHQTDRFLSGLAEELKQLEYQADQKICIISDSNVAKLYAETVKNILTKSFPQIFCYEFQAGEASKIQIPSMVFMNF